MNLEYLVRDKDTGYEYEKQDLPEEKRLVLKNKEDDEKIEWMKGDDFIKLFDNVLEELSNEKLTGNQFKILITMLRFLDYESGALVDNKKKSLSIDFIHNLTGISRSYFFVDVKRLLEKRMICKAKFVNEFEDLTYFVNPYIFAKGKKVNKTLYQMFKNSKWALCVHRR